MVGDKIKNTDVFSCHEQRVAQKIGFELMHHQIGREGIADDCGVSKECGGVKLRLGRDSLEGLQLAPGHLKQLFPVIGQASGFAFHTLVAPATGDFGGAHPLSGQNAILKGVILITAILVQTVGPELKKRLPKRR